MQHLIRFIQIGIAMLTTVPLLHAAAPVINSLATDSVQLGSPYSYTITTGTDGTADEPVIYNSTALPAGLNLNALTGVISGTPTESGRFTMGLFATNASNQTSASFTLTLDVTDPTPVITSDLTISPNESSPFTYSITATNNPTTFNVIGLGVIPTDAVDTSSLALTGQFSFTPSSGSAGDSYNLLIQAENGAGLTSELLTVNIQPALAPTPSTATVILNSPTSGSLVDYYPDLSATNQITVAASVTPSAGETIDTVFVRWNNPPAKPDGTPRAPIIMAQLVNTAGNDYQATVDIGFDPENREIGGGSIDLEVVAYQTNALSTGDFASGSSTFRVEPLLEMLFPDDNLTRGFFDVGDIFASARVGTNDFSKVTARISGPGIVFSSEDDDASDNENGVHNFDLPQLINFEGTYTVEVIAEDLSGATTVVRKQLFLSEIIGAPTALIVSPNPGFTNEVFTPAVLQYTETSRAIVTVNEVGVVGVNVSYSLSLVSAGQGYFPRNASGATLLTTGGNDVTRGIPEVTLSNGRISDLPDTVTIFYSRDSNGDSILDDPEDEWGSFGNAIMDDLGDPGANGKIDISAQFFRALGDLKTYKLFVNGADLTPGNGNLDPDDGAVDIPAIEFPPAGQGSPDPGDYVVFAQVFDENGQTDTSFPITFQILPYEPLEISVSRQVGAGASVSDPVLIGGSATFLAEINPVDEIEEVEFFESNSGNSLGFGSRVQISGDTFFRFSNVFAEAGDFKVFARATGYNGQTVISTPVDISVLSGDFPTVEITSPADGDSVTAGNNLPILIQAGDADGQITAVEVFDGTSSLGTATPTGLAGEYRLNFTPTVSDIGVLNLIARATDDRGNQTSSEVVVVGVVRGEVPQIEILEPAEGDSLNVGQPFIVRARITDGDGIITSATLTDLNFFTELVNGGTILVSGSLSFGGDVMSASSTPDEFVFIATIENPDVVDLVVTATDDDGNTVQSEIVQFTVTAGVVPDAEITAPLSGSGPYTRGSLIPVEITASDLDGSVTQVEVFNGATSLGLASLAGADTYRFDYVANSVGLVNLQARATDDTGNVGISNVETISVVTGNIPTVTIDSPADDTEFDLGDAVSFEISASDTDGFITTVTLFDVTGGGETQLGNALFVDSVSNDQYRFTLDTSTLAAGTKQIAVVAVDNSGNNAQDIVTIDLKTVPFSVTFTDPTSNPHSPVAGAGEFLSVSDAYTVEVSGIEATSLQSLEWQLDAEDPVTQDLSGGTLIFTQTFAVEEAFSTLTVTATNTDNVAVSTTLVITPNFPDPENDLSNFVDYLYYRIRGTEPSAPEKQAALDYFSANGDTPQTRAAVAAAIFPQEQYLESNQTRAALVYKTLTGSWPTAEELQTVLASLESDPEALSLQTVETQTGSISSGGTATLTFNYTAGTEVTIRVSGDGSSGSPLTDPTLTVNAPDGTFVGYSDDNFASGVFDLDAVLAFTATQSGAYTATVRGFSVSQAGNFAAVSTSISTESDNALLLARALVDLLQDSYNGSNGFLANADVANPSLAPAFVAQLYRNKHGVGITTFNSAVLGYRLTGTSQDQGNGYILPGYSGDVLSYTAAFAIDTELATGVLASIKTHDGFPYTSGLYYGRPNDALAGWDAESVNVQTSSNIAFAVSALLGIESPSAADLAPYDGMTLEQALATLFASSDFSDQFLSVTQAADAFTAGKMAELGEFDFSKIAANDDADGDGMPNAAEILLGSNPADASDTASPGGVSIPNETTFSFTYVRLKEALTPAGLSVGVECSPTLDGSFSSSHESAVEVLASDQSNLPGDDYERIEFSVDMTAQDCGFFRLKVNGL